MRAEVVRAGAGEPVDFDATQGVAQLGRAVGGGTDEVALDGDRPGRRAVAQHHEDAILSIAGDHVAFGLGWTTDRIRACAEDGDAIAGVGQCRRASGIRANEVANDSVPEPIASSTPLPVLPEMTLRAAVLVPPNVSFEPLTRTPLTLPVMVLPLTTF